MKQFNVSRIEYIIELSYWDFATYADGRWSYEDIDEYSEADLSEAM